MLVVDDNDSSDEDDDDDDRGISESDDEELDELDEPDFVFGAGFAMPSSSVSEIECSSPLTVLRLHSAT